MSADPALVHRDPLAAEYVTWTRYSEDRRELLGRFDRLEAKIDALAEKVTGGRERSAEWTLRAFLVAGAAGLSAFLATVIR